MSTEINEVQMPAPDTMVLRADGSAIAAMFYFAASEQRLDHIAHEQGFETSFVAMFETLDEDDPIYRRYDGGDASAVDEWSPPVPDGWQVGAKYDTEEGPYACLIRRRDVAQGAVQ